MDTIGWLLIIGAGFLIRAVSKGRSISQLPGDIGDAFTAAVSGNGTELSSVLSRTGSSLDPVTPDPVASAAEVNQAAGIGTANGAALLAAMRKRGSVAKGYVWGATGPDYYDCSGLVWRSLKDIGADNGTRFTTATFIAQSSGWATKVTAPTVGDIVLWPGRHIGVVSGNDEFYSALGVKEGIKDAAIHAVNEGTPVYYRIGK